VKTTLLSLVQRVLWIELTIARTILLLAILIDDNPDEVSSAWNIFHDFTIDNRALSLIKGKSTGLLKVSESIETWNAGPYSKWIRIVNSETLDAVREIWTRYASHDESKSFHQYLQARQLEFVERNYVDSGDPTKHPAPLLAASFGMFAEHTKPLALRHMGEFWTSGISDSNDKATPQHTSNPLFVYTRSVGDKFIVPLNSSPIAIYHLRAAAAKSSGKPTEEMLSETGRVARSQFKEWCQAFQDFVKNPDSGKLILGFVSADPISLCFAIQQRIDSSKRNLINLSRNWCGVPLVIDGDVPQTFNVINTSRLVDTCGGINILVATIPLLQIDRASTLHMTSHGQRTYSQEVHLLDDILLGKPRNFVCGLFGLSPIDALTHATTKALAQDTPFIHSPKAKGASMMTEIIWKFPWSGDQNISRPIPLNFEDFEEFGKLLFEIYTSMWGKDPSQPKSIREKRIYIDPGFAALLAFFKSRITADWKSVISALVAKQMNVSSWARKPITILCWYFHLYGVQTQDPDFFSVQKVTPKYTPTGSFGVLSLKNPPWISVLSLTVPRKSLLPLQTRIFDNLVGECYQFEIRMSGDSDKWEGYSFVFQDMTPLFGKLVVDEEGLVGKIEIDNSGWHGESDLHLFIHLPTNLLCHFSTESLQRTKFSLHLWETPVMKKIFHDAYGNDLEIFKARLLDPTYMHVLKHLEGMKISPKTIPAIESKPKVHGGVKVYQPYILHMDPTAVLSVRVKTLSKAASLNLRSAKVSIESASPCTLLLRYGNASHLCQFPFPVIDTNALFRINKKNSSIDFVAEFSDQPETLEGGYIRDLFPLVRSPATGPTSWNLPLINFERLDPFDYSQFAKRCGDFCLSQYRCDQEMAGTERPLLTRLKDIVFGLFDFLLRSGPNPMPMGICVRGSRKAYFFITGLFYDDASHSLTAEAFYYPVPSLSKVPKFKDPRGLYALDMPENVFEAWNRSIPAMVERCRNWEPLETCEYLGDFIPGEICSCGKGKVSSAFRARSYWSEFEAHVVRCAFSPVFPSPFVEKATMTRNMEGFGGEATDSAKSEGGKERPSWLGLVEMEMCHKCGKIGHLKMCSRCGAAYYCGSECQKAHWKKHKPDCVPKE
jgi:hypothetical protein